MKYKTTYLILFLIVMAACNNHSKSKEYKIVALTKDDSTFLALKDTAQVHLLTFVNIVKLHGKDKKYKLAVKSDFVEKGVHEHMWSRIYEYNNGVFKGEFADSAIDLKNIKFGNAVSISQDGIEDWSIYNTVTHESSGNFSDKYLNSKIKPKDN